MREARACIKSLWGMSRPVRWRMAVNVGIGILRIAASLGFVAASKLLVDIATGNSTMAIGPAIGLFLGILACQLGTTIFSSWWDSYCQVKSQNIRKLVLKLENGIDMKKVREYLLLAQTQMLADKRYSSLQVYYDVDPL